MCDSEDDSIGSSITCSSESELSDTDSRDESPSSGFIDDTEESVSVFSDRAGNSVILKQKKHVTFQNDANLVHIREIPPRCNKGRTDSESGDSEDDDNPYKITILPDNSIAKGNYNVKKSSGRTAAKIAAITGACLPDSRKNSENRKNGKKRLARKERRKNNNGASLSVQSQDVSTNNPEQTVKSAKHRTGRQKGTKKHINKNKVKLKDPDKSKPVTKCETVPLCSKQNPKQSSVVNKKDDMEITESSPTTKIIDLLDNESDNNMFKRIEKVYLVEKEFNMRPQNSKDLVQSRDRLDVKAMSKTNRRLYSWLMANGDIPSPIQESPSISPMWESSVTMMPSTSIVKAPT